MFNFVIKVFEIWIWLTVALFMWGALLQVLYEGSFSYFNVFWDLSYLIWYRATSILVSVLCWILVVMAWRWIISFVSWNGWQTPNQNWN